MHTIINVFKTKGTYFAVVIDEMKNLESQDIEQLTLKIQDWLDANKVEIYQVHQVSQYHQLQQKGGIVFPIEVESLSTFEYEELIARLSGTYMEPECVELIAFQIRKVIEGDGKYSLSLNLTGTVTRSEHTSLEELSQVVYKCLWNLKHHSFSFLASEEDLWDQSLTQKEIGDFYKFFGELYSQ